MSRWEAPRSRRGPGAVLPVVLLAVLGAVAAWALTARPAPRDDDARATVVDDTTWTRPRPGLWLSLPVAPVTSRIDHAIAGHDDRVAVWGGFDSRGHPLPDGAVFDVGTGTWTRVPAVGPRGTSAEAVWVGDDVVVVTATATRAWDTRRRIWRIGPTLPDAVGAPERLGVAGGVVVAVVRPVADGAGAGPTVLAWPRDGRRWRPLPDPPVAPSATAVLVPTASRLTILRPGAKGRGGVGADIDPSRPGSAWRTIAPPPRATRPLARLLGVAVGDRVVLVGADADGVAVYAAVRDRRGTWRRIPVPPEAVTADDDLLASARRAVLWDRRVGAGATLDLVAGRWGRVPRSPAADGVPRPAVVVGADLVTWGGLGPIGAVHRIR